LIRYRFSRLLDVVRLAWWSRIQQRVWKQQASRDQLDQIIWRLERGGLTVDGKAALALAKQLRARL
jgi:hypothetical protein